MLTAAFVTMVSDEIGAAWTRTQILDVMNDCQNEILGEDCGLMRVRPDPFLTTADATFSYGASASLFDSSANTKGAAVGDVRTVRKIYSYNNSVSIFDAQTLDPASEKPNQVEFTQTKDLVTMRMDVIDSLGPTLADCTLKLYATNNPGATTVSWRAECYLWPNQLTAESVALSIPADFQRSLLLFDVLKILERREYGRSDAAMQTYEMYRKKFRRRYNAQISSDLRVAPFRVV